VFSIHTASWRLYLCVSEKFIYYVKLFAFMLQKVKDTIKKYKLINKNDKVIVAASGGKDSTVVLFLLNKLGYDVIALNIDAGINKYSQANLDNLRKFCNDYNIELYETSFEKEYGIELSKVKSRLSGIDKNLKICTVCGILRRYLLNKIARKLKADKIVTGHNLDDEAQAILMNLFKANTNVSARLGPMVGVIKDKKFTPRIKPLYFVSEKEIEKFSKKMKFPVLYDDCPFVEEAYRKTVRDMLTDYEEKHEGTKLNIVKQFLTLLPELKKRYKGELNFCRECGEPSAGDICNRCMLMKRLTLNKSK
jgi:uncharacterized protein (TIGR00269 family)